VRAMNPLTNRESGQAAPHGSAIYRTHQQTQRTSPEIQLGCPLSLGLLQTSYLPAPCTSATASSCHAPGTWKQH
jgi:hypothetical protein